MATEYKIENRVLYIYLDGDLDHHLAKKVKHKCDIILKSYPIKDILKTQDLSIVQGLE